MSYIRAPQTSADLTADGSAAGFVTVASNATFFPGCIVWLTSTTTSQRCLIIKLVGTNQIYLRFVPEEFQKNAPAAPKDGFSDCSPFTLVKASRLNMEAQVAPVDPAFSKLLSG